ncbi:uncharacterized protein M6B38_263700 [Iris pallida]|uniref:Uncharacterized protein n=1 Tax=Iris pallida TaxID=29817 RepID=A0AAX6IBY6_IRIPA|nr:uncharacterized protein M6B38_263700 [Iris pallida]
MDSEKENQVIPSPELEKNPKKLTYTREFLLSLSKLDACKKLPSGFDASILSDFEDNFSGACERRPLSQGYARGGQGRWDTRSSGSSDRDGDLQSDREPLVQDTGRRFGNQSRRIWPNSEHDGLLGSGAFPRPSGYMGTPTQKARGNEHCQLKKSTEPYQPPRPYKAATYSRKDFTDSFNDETFGSAECSNEDRAEEERKRRASFELMRKEQQKALQEKHKPNPENRKENLGVDIFAMLGNSVGVRSGDKSDESAAASLSHSDLSKSSLHIQAPGSRPLVPPGFACTSMEKKLSLQSSSTSHILEAGSALVENDHSVNRVENDQDKNSSVACTQFKVEQNETIGVSALSVDANENLVAPTSSCKVLEQALDSGNVPGMTDSIQEATEVWEDNIATDLQYQNEAVSEIMNTSSQDHSTTILEKLFSSALSKNYGPNAIEHEGVKVDEDSRSLALSESSKLSLWFSEGAKKPVEDFSSRDLLSLIASNAKVNSQVSINERATEPILPGLPSENIETALMLHSPLTSSVQKLEQYSQVDKKSPSSAVLTCEDLEQSILAEVVDSSPSLQLPTIQETWIPVEGNMKEQKVDANDHASQHLLSLLQKGTSLKSSLFPGADFIESSDRNTANDVSGSLNIQISDRVRNPEKVSSEQSITLETLFGSAFMNELHSAEAPVSANRGSAGTVNQADITQPHGLQFSHVDNGFFSSVSPESRSNKIIHEGERLAFNNTQKNPNISAPWYIDNPVEGSKLHGMGTEVGGAVDVQLPDEDSLITVCDALKPVTSDPFPFENVQKTEILHGNTGEDLNDRLFGGMLRDGERSRTHVPEGPQLHNGPFEMVDPDTLFNHLHSTPSPQYPYQMNQTRPSFPQLDHLTQRNAHLKFVGPDASHQHHSSHHFPGNFIPHHAFSSVGSPRFDPAVAHHPMLQHMPVQGNFPPHHSMQGLPRDIRPSHPINRIPGYIPEMNNIHNFTLHQRQPNYGAGLGMGLPGSVAQGSGGHHPEALERLIEMELRANSKHSHPTVAGQIPGIPGIYTQLDMNFRYQKK